MVPISNPATPLCPHFWSGKKERNLCGGIFIPVGILSSKHINKVPPFNVNLVDVRKTGHVSTLITWNTSEKIQITQNNNCTTLLCLCQTLSEILVQDFLFFSTNPHWSFLDVVKQRLDSQLLGSFNLDYCTDLWPEWPFQWFCNSKKMQPVQILLLWVVTLWVLMKIHALVSPLKWSLTLIQYF